MEHCSAVSYLGRFRNPDEDLTNTKVRLYMDKRVCRPAGNLNVLRAFRTFRSLRVYQLIHK
ncbi:6e1f0d42-fec1-4dbb-a323-3ecd585a9961-CDS [Sclerotinia trifoliorum]|uniref:6e1f0d42-fec1-4dbb-a323-3ecd585a9961-CDS n=1 Tax=Sclerotinia trifoliorum TaxID=28548 RepID=A0A8H2ZU46_9HELO|nr:6e1f0d42-fec1-4dbb-a323-3ecd585a9961-CDS [Sclerotinia trifoliorum]